MMRPFSKRLLIYTYVYIILIYTYVYIYIYYIYTNFYKNIFFITSILSKISFQPNIIIINYRIQLCFNAAV